MELAIASKIVEGVGWLIAIVAIVIEIVATVQHEKKAGLVSLEEKERLAMIESLVFILFLVGCAIALVGFIIGLFAK